MSGVPYRVVVLDKDRRIVSRGETAIAHPSSVVGSALAHAPIGAVMHSMGIDYERAASPVAPSLVQRTATSLTPGSGERKEHP